MMGTEINSDSSSQPLTFVAFKKLVKLSDGRGFIRKETIPISERKWKC